MINLLNQSCGKCSLQQIKCRLYMVHLKQMVQLSCDVDIYKWEPMVVHSALAGFGLYFS